ncbi:hypothetical protein DMJ13_09675 [halophilic archaeon]|nr:hypothetical protein DMJ13_09675 [halophilic archaeon]
MFLLVVRVRSLSTIALAQVARRDSSVRTPLAYSFFASQQPLRGIRLGITIVVIYLLWRFLVAVEAIADALQRFARQREQDR